jgi:SAM-dependent methyltransferase
MNAQINIQGTAGDTFDKPAAILFQQQWQLYRKFVDNNYFYHREVYGQLHRVLVEEAVQPFRFLDIACGDARASVDALRGTPVAHYHGIDLSQAALELASKALEPLGCSDVLSRRTIAISSKRFAIGLSLQMSRGSVCRCTSNALSHFGY